MIRSSNIRLHGTETQLHIYELTQINYVVAHLARAYIILQIKTTKQKSKPNNVIDGGKFR